MTDIKLVSTKDLLSEVFNRTDHAVFHSQQEGVYKKDEVVKTYRCKGNFMVCLALGERIIHNVHKQIDSTDYDIKNLR